MAYGEGVDVWACACLAAEMCSGRPLFPGQDEGELVSMWKKTPSMYDRGIPFFGYVVFLKDGAFLTQIYREKKKYRSFSLFFSASMILGHGKFFSFFFCGYSLLQIIVSGELSS